MAVTELVQEYLRQSNVAYSVFPHVPAYSAQEEAAVTHISGRDWAKPVVFFADGEPVMAVVPADLVIDVERLLLLTGAERIRLATEEELAALYPDCEPGAMPPLGPLYNQSVFVDVNLAAQPQIVFNGGTHGDAVCMRYDDFAALAQPVVGSFATRAVF
ncbi:MAG: YbaK/EbsC family protein [Acidobacteria bacterium]|nr:YbaK/EbsC family protein [Acidobacteriota bacterium]